MAVVIVTALRALTAVQDRLFAKITCSRAEVSTPPRLSHHRHYYARRGTDRVTIVR